ncbi:MAG TPA: hypothetical protein VJ755_04765 [Gemmatimonadales bacterium]|nr:hypothetical protein [Gemmatimonadales bacterium]
MQRPLALLAMLAGVVSAASAQQSWRTEFGIQGGFTRLVEAGAGLDPIDAISVPGFNLGNALPAPAGLYAIIPWSSKFAVETEIAASQFSLAGGTASLISAGLRGDYALTNNLYLAAGGALVYNNGLANETQLGVQGALGFRFGLTGTLSARIEGRTTFYGKADNAVPADVYSLLFGVSTATSGGRAPAGSSTRPPTGAWRPQLGLAGGYADAHLIGIGSVTSLSFPGYGGAVGNALGGFLSTLQAVALPPTVFAIIPIADKVAIEPGLDIHRFQSGGQTDFSGNLSVRLDYAVHGGWYGALGGNLHYIQTSGANAATRTGVNLGWGYRFPLVLGVTGRVEANYTMFGENTDLALPPTNVFGLMFGAAMPIN